MRLDYEVLPVMSDGTDGTAVTTGTAVFERIKEARPTVKISFDVPLQTIGASVTEKFRVSLAEAGTNPKTGAGAAAFDFATGIDLTPHANTTVTLMIDTPVFLTDPGTAFDDTDRVFEISKVTDGNGDTVSRVSDVTGDNATLTIELDPAVFEDTQITPANLYPAGGFFRIPFARYPSAEIFGSASSAGNFTCAKSGVRGPGITANDIRVIDEGSRALAGRERLYFESDTNRSEQTASGSGTRRSLGVSDGC